MDVLKARQQPTLAVDGPWLLKADDGEQRVWLHEFNTVRNLRRDTLINGVWVTTSYFQNNKWEPVDDG